MSVPARVSEHLFASFITRLTPLFAIGTTDLALAEAQAVELVNGFGIRSAWDLFSVARIVGLGMASLASIELSARPDLSAAFAVRCRSNADALHRTAERSEHRLRKQQGEGEAATPRRSAPDRAAISATLQAVAETRRRLDQAKAELTAPEPVPKLSGPEPPGLEPMGPEPVPKPSGPEPPGLELMGPEPVPKPSGPEPPGLELMGPEPMGLEPMGSEEAGLQPAGPGLVKTALAERTGAGPAEAEQTRARLAKPRPAPAMAAPAPPGVPPAAAAVAPARGPASVAAADANPAGPAQTAAAPVADQTATQTGSVTARSAVPAAAAAAIAKAVPARRPPDRFVWANGIAAVMEELTQGLPQLSTAEQRKQLQHINALRAATENLIVSGTITGETQGTVPSGVSDAVSAMALLSLPTPPGVVPPGVVPPGVIPPGIVPAGMVASGVVPSGAVPPGVIPPGVVPPGVVPSGGQHDGPAMPHARRPPA